jgi:tRNA modification GTPase
MKLGRIGLEPALAVYMKSPHSYTGDDVVEIQCHGGVAAADHALKKIFAAGARCADPGEFTFRAFVNGKLDLVQCEAVADLIESNNDMAMKIASRQLDGLLSNRLGVLREQLIFCLSECESRLDFPEENLDWYEELPEKLANAVEQLQILLDSAKRGDIFRNGVKTVIVGKPNAGKSSLLNFLLGYERAIVTDIAGTTRDSLEEKIVLRNIPVRLIDTAGLRENAGEIEKIGIDIKSIICYYIRVLHFLTKCERMRLGNPFWKKGSPQTPS